MKFLREVFQDLKKALNRDKLAISCDRFSVGCAVYNHPYVTIMAMFVISITMFGGMSILADNNSVGDIAWVLVCSLLFSLAASTLAISMSGDGYGGRHERKQLISKELMNVWIELMSINDLVPPRHLSHKALIATYDYWCNVDKADKTLQMAALSHTIRWLRRRMSPAAN